MIKDILYWSPSFMGLTEAAFFMFLAVACVLYYSAGKTLQKYVLLAASLFFYLCAAGIKLYKLAAVLVFVIGVTYIGGLLIGRSRGRTRTALTWLSVSALVGAWFVMKSAYNILSLFVADGESVEFLKFFPLIGLSYYTLSAIGYLLDVSWEIYEPERNPANVALYVCFFPQVISGPVTRYSQMGGQFSAYHPLEYENISRGLMRMILGYFKKLVISERFGVIVYVAVAQISPVSSSVA